MLTHRIAFCCTRTNCNIFTSVSQLENLRDSHSCKEQALSSLQEQFTELHSRLNTPHPTIVAYDDELATPTGGNGHVEDTDFGLPPDYDPAFNINDFISAPPVDVGTQKGASEFYDMATQLPYPYDPDWQPAHQSVQTSAADVLYPMEHYLETLFRDFATESQNYIPEGNLAILRSSRPQDSAKEPTSR